MAHQCYLPEEKLLRLDIKEARLLYPPPTKETMRGSIAMDDTDFKEGVAYLFELRKRQRAAYAEMKAKQSQAVAVNTTPKATPNSAPKTKVNERKLVLLF